MTWRQRFGRQETLKSRNATFSGESLKPQSVGVLRLSVILLNKWSSGVISLEVLVQPHIVAIHDLSATDSICSFIKARPGQTSLFRGMRCDLTIDSQMPDETNSRSTC